MWLYYENSKGIVVTKTKNYRQFPQISDYPTVHQLTLCSSVEPFNSPISLR
jgi:hypothetical protein